MRLRHDLLGDHCQCEGNTRRNDEQIVEITEDGHEGRYQVNGAEGVANDKEDQAPGVPGSTGIPRCQEEGVYFGPERAGLGLEAGKHG